MANINLGKYYRKSSDRLSTVDSKIFLNKKETEKKFYGDIKLDLSFDEIISRSLNAEIANKDLNLTYNEESIINSLRNIFKTYRGSRLLNPEMSFELQGYLFEPITTSKAFFLGYDLMNLIPKYEPRVTVRNIAVLANPEDASYNIELTITIPEFSKNLNLACLLNEESFSIIP